MAEHECVDTSRTAWEDYHLVRRTQTNYRVGAAGAQEGIITKSKTLLSMRFELMISRLLSERLSQLGQESSSTSCHW